MRQVSSETRTTGADRMTQRDRTSVHVHLARIEVEHFDVGQHDHTKRLVDLEQRDVLFLEASLFKKFLRGVDGRDREIDGIRSRIAVADNASQWFQVVLFDGLFVHEKQSAGAIV